MDPFYVFLYCFSFNMQFWYFSICYQIQKVSESRTIQQRNSSIQSCEWGKTCKQKKLIIEVGCCRQDTFFVTIMLCIINASKIMTKIFFPINMESMQICSCQHVPQLCAQQVCKKWLASRVTLTFGRKGHRERGTAVNIAADFKWTSSLTESLTERRLVHTPVQLRWSVVMCIQAFLSC